MKLYKEPALKIVILFRWATEDEEQFAFPFIVTSAVWQTMTGGLQI